MSDETPQQQQQEQQAYDDLAFNGSLPPGVPPITVPRVAHFNTSYGEALHQQRNAGRQAAPYRPPQSLGADETTPVEEETTAAAAPTPSAPPVRVSGKALVKAVPSGDTLIVVGNAAPGQIPPEKQIVLSGCQAPRLRGRKGQDDPFAHHSRDFLRNLCLGKVVSFEINHRHEASGREYGVVFLESDGRNVAEEIISSGWCAANRGGARKDGTLHPERQALVDLEETAKASKLGIWQDVKKPARFIRKVDWKPNTQKLLKQSKDKVLPAILDYVRDGSTFRVEILSTDGSLRHRMVMLHLAGVTAPRIPIPLSVRKNNWKRDKERDPNLNRPEPKEEPAEPFALAAKDFVEQRLLHRDIGVQILGVDKFGNTFGSIVFTKGNISVELVKNGLARYTAWSAAYTNDGPALEAAQAHAQANRFNMWRNGVDAAAASASQQRPPSGVQGGTVYDGEFIGRVVQIFSGDTVIIADGHGNERRFPLASVQAPRLGNPRRGEKDAPYSVEAKEFMRKKLIGKKVKVVVEYTRPPFKNASGPDANEDRPFVTVFQGKVNIAQQLVANGLATVVKHRVEEDRSVHYPALLDAEQKATELKKNIHSNKKPKVHSFIDFTQRFGKRPRKGKKASKGKKDDAEPDAGNDDAGSDEAAAATDGADAESGAGKKDDAASIEESKAVQLSAKARQFLPFLQKERNLKGVVEHVFTGSRLKIFIPRQNCMVSFVLAGVRCPAPSGGRGKNARKGEEGGDEALSFVRSACLQHDVRLEIETLDRGNNFIGSVLLDGGRNLSIELTARGLASVYVPSAERSEHGPALMAAEKQAKESKIGIWKNWTPPPKPDPAELAAAKAKAAAEAEEEPKEVPENQRFISVSVTEIIDAANFYVHIEGSNAIPFIEDKMRAFGEENSEPLAVPYEPKRGTTCAGKFSVDGQWYRVRIEARTEEGYTVFFIDYGNSDILQKEDLRPIRDEAVLKVQPLARVCTLAGTKAPNHKQEAFDMAIEAFTELAYNRKLLAQVHIRDRTGKMHVTLHDEESPDSINQLLLRDGLLRILARPERQLSDLVEKELRPEQEKAKANHYNIWEYGDVSDDEDETAVRDRDRRN